LRNAPSTEQARDAFESRLMALSRAHDVLTRENWEGARGGARGAFGSARPVGSREGREGTAGHRSCGSDAPRAAAPLIPGLALRLLRQDRGPEAVRLKRCRAALPPHNEAQDGRGRRQGRVARPDRADTCEAEDPETPSCEDGLGAASRPASRRLRKRPLAGGTALLSTLGIFVKRNFLAGAAPGGDRHLSGCTPCGWRGRVRSG
jgi:hypothetical protein